MTAARHIGDHLNSQQRAAEVNKAVHAVCLLLWAHHRLTDRLGVDGVVPAALDKQLDIVRRQQAHRGTMCPSRPIARPR